MRKKIFIFLVMSLLLVGMMTSAVIASEKEVRIFVDGKEVQFPDVKPYIDGNGRTMVPVRFVSEEMGAVVDWRPANKNVHIEKGDRVIDLWIGKKEYKVNGATRTMDTVAVLKEARTFVPVRFVSEGLGAFMDYRPVGKYGLVFSFTLGQSAEEREQIINEVIKKVEGETGGNNKPRDGEVITPKTHGNMTGKEWGIGEYFVLDSPLAKAHEESVVLEITLDQLRQGRYRVAGTEILDITYHPERSDIGDDGKIDVHIKQVEGRQMVEFFYLTDMYEDRGPVSWFQLGYNTISKLLNKPRDNFELSDIRYFGFFGVKDKEILLVKNPYYKE